MSSLPAVPDRPRPGRLARDLARWAIVLVIFFFIARWLVSSWDQIRDAQLTFSLPWLVASVVVLAAYMEGRALVWQVLTSMLGTAIPLRMGTAAWFYSQLGKYVPGKVFLYLARLHFYVREGRKAGPVSLAFGIELIGTFSASILTLLLALLTVDLGGVGPDRGWLFVALIAMLIFVHPRVLDRIVHLASRILRRPAFAVNVRYGQMLGFVALYVLNWLVFGVALFAFIRSFYLLQVESILFLAGAFSFASLVGMLSVFVPSGLGVREGILALLLARIMPEGLAVVAALSARIWFSLVELMCLGIVAVAVGRGSRPRGEELERLRGEGVSP